VTISVIQSAEVDATSALTFDDDVTAGNSVVFILGAYTAATSGRFTSGNPRFAGNPVNGIQLEQGQGAYAGSGFGYTTIWLLPDLAGGSPDVEVDITSGPDGGVLGAFGFEVAGLGPAPQLDPDGGKSDATGISASLNSGALPDIDQAPALIVGYGHIYAQPVSDPSDPSWTVMSPLGGFLNFQAGYQVAPAAGKSFDWSQAAAASETWGAAVVAICAQPAPGPPGPGLLLASFP
jgi:hypothetical protein